MKSHADLIFSNPSDIADYDVDLWRGVSGPILFVEFEFPRPDFF